MRLPCRPMLDKILISRAKDEAGAAKDHLHFEAIQTKKREEQEAAVAAQSADAT